MKEHVQYCAMRPQPCPYCELILNSDDYDSHLKFCGSKTKNCPDCNALIRMSELESHIESGTCKLIKEIQAEENVEEELH